MLRLLVVSVGLLWASGIAASAMDVAPITCAWTKLTESEQTELREGFKTDSGGTSHSLEFAAPSLAVVARVNAACELGYNEAQSTELANALGAKAAEELARWAVDKRGAIDSAVIDAALAKMNEVKRVIIGDALSCPGTVDITLEWDGSVFKAMNRARMKTVDGRTVALVSIAMLSVFHQEGNMRRINGTAAPCSENSSDS